MAERSRYERLFLDALSTLIADAVARGAYDEAIGYAQRYLQTDPLEEEIHRRLIQLYIATGDRSAAMQQYEKTNFYGTLKLRTGDEYVMQAEKLNSATTALHLEQLLAALPNVPILLLWDKARHHMGESVQQLLAQNPRLEVLFFLTASPDLNPQEHVWKAVRSAISHNHADKDLSTLATRFQSSLETHSFPSSFLDSYGFNSICPAFS